MFKSARIKLTVWYLLIIMTVSVSFSAVIYRVLTIELDRVERVQRLRIEYRLPDGLRMPLPVEDVQRRRLLQIDPDLVTETKERLIIFLLMINTGILSASAVLGYLLAGMTLTPIKDMVEEQKRFITDASHELRTPLTSLRTEIEVNLRDKNFTLASARKLLASNLEEVVNLQSLSDNLIKLAQYQDKNGGIEFKEISLQEAIDDSLKKIMPMAFRKNITISNSTGDYQINGNTQKITELLVILLDNAIKYSKKNSRVLLTTRQSDQKIEITIEDHGEGIKKDDLLHIFDRFYRADKSRSKEKINGYGLGLSIAKKIVVMHGGTISAESKFGYGTKFTVNLPLTDKI